MPAVSGVSDYGISQGVRIASDAITYCGSGLQDMTKKMTLSFLHKAIKVHNQLRMIEDAIVIYRLSRAPERRIFYIDVGNLPKVKAEQYLRDVMARYRNKLVYDANTGEIRDDKKHMSMLEDTGYVALPAFQCLGNRLRHHFLLGGAHDHDDHALHRTSPIQARLHPRFGPRCAG